MITKVVMGAQYASGSRANRATNSEATATSAVRAECTNADRTSGATLPRSTECARNADRAQSRVTYQRFEAEPLVEEDAAAGQLQHVGFGCLCER